MVGAIVAGAIVVGEMDGGAVGLVVEGGTVGPVVEGDTVGLVVEGGMVGLVVEGDTVGLVVEGDTVGLVVGDAVGWVVGKVVGDLVGVAEGASARHDDSQSAFTLFKHREYTWVEVEMEMEDAVTLPKVEKFRYVNTDPGEDPNTAAKDCGVELAVDGKYTVETTVALPPIMLLIDTVAVVTPATAAICAEKSERNEAL
eukprot:gene3853-4814_t